MEPDAPTAPSRGSNTDYNVLHLTWPSISNYGTASGGSTAAISSYEIQRNLGNSSISDATADIYLTLQGNPSNSTST